MALAPTEDKLETLEWSTLSVIHDEGEGEWIGVEEESYFLDPEDFR